MVWKKKEPVSNEPEVQIPKSGQTKKLEDYREMPEEEETVYEEDVQPKRLAPKSNKKTWSLENVAVQTEAVIYNNVTGKGYTLHEAIVEILNRTEE